MSDQILGSQLKIIMRALQDVIRAAAQMDLQGVHVKSLRIPGAEVLRVSFGQRATSVTSELSNIAIVSITWPHACFGPQVNLRT